MLDLELPDMDGVKIIENIREWSIVPIIVVSARSEDADKIRALDAGADDYLTKPFSIEELLARIRVAQRRLTMQQSSGVSETAVFKNGQIEIDYAAGCAYLNGHELHLTPIEYKLLCLLSKNVGKVLTHTFITHAIWEKIWRAMWRRCGYIWRHCVKSWRISRICSSIFRRTLVLATECCG